MKRAWPLALLLCSCVTEGPKPSVPSGPIVELRESFACPLPASRGLLTISRDGGVERVVFDGLEYEPGKTKTTRETMKLPRKDADEMFALASASGWQKMASALEEGFSPTRPPGSDMCADCCEGAFYVKTSDGGRSIHYKGLRRDKKLAKLMSDIDSILARFTWTPAPVYVPEPPKP